MRLIDADVLMADVRNTITEESGVIDWVNLINRQPTAYDPDEVVKQLKELGKECEDPLQDCDPNYFIEKAIEIVKDGGVDGQKQSK